jgi:site-specific recombinase XerD
MITVHVFVRHSKDCKYKRNRFYKRCTCKKWFQWNDKGEQIRKPAKTREWDVAVKLAQGIEENYERAALGKPVTNTGQTIENAVTLYLMDKESQYLSPATMSKLRTIFEKQFQTWCHDMGLYLLNEVTLAHLVAWRGSWTDKALAARKKQERVRGFFWFCVKNHWMAENLALGLSKIKADHRPAVPFMPEEFESILLACDRFAKIEEHRTRMRAMVLLLRWSGLAIRDAVTLERERLDSSDRLILRRAKTGVHVFVPLPPDVAQALRDLASPNPRFFFWTGNGLPKSAVADWQRALRRVFDLADIKHSDGKKKRCHAHMFRHTFSVEMLVAGVPVEDVARLLGHSSIRTTEKYYAPWIKARADRLEEVVKMAWPAGKTQVATTQS